jgi:hypothetical protein
VIGESSPDDRNGDIDLLSITNGIIAIVGAIVDSTSASPTEISSCERCSFEILEIFPFRSSNSNSLGVDA